MGDITPDQIANFDQALADAENNLDVLIDLWRTGDPDSPEHIRIAGLCGALGERPEWDRIALAEHLTVAIRRLDRARQAATPDGPRRCVHETWRCDHCHDDPPPGHICPACGAQPVGPLTDTAPAAVGQDGDGRG